VSKCKQDLGNRNYKTLKKNTRVAKNSFATLSILQSKSTQNVSSPLCG